MPICIGMTPHFISCPCWCCHQQAALHPNFEFAMHSSVVVGVVTNNSPYIPISQSFTLLNGLLVTTPTMARASHQDGYSIYRQFIAKHVFYFASEMPICIGMTPHFISCRCWCRHQQRLRGKFNKPGS
jgi:hypothetical protein